MRSIMSDRTSSHEEQATEQSSMLQRGVQTREADGIVHGKLLVKQCELLKLTRQGCSFPHNSVPDRATTRGSIRAILLYLSPHDHFRFLDNPISIRHPFFTNCISIRAYFPRRALK